MGSCAYRITHAGKAAFAGGQPPLRSRYLMDLLDLLETRAGGVQERELRQFMPPASLEESILALLALELIEREHQPA
jgi:hypothetical protein